MRKARQLGLRRTSGWGGKREGAGRKLVPGKRPSVSHRARPVHARANPLHATLRACPDVRALRHRRAFAAIKEAVRSASKPAFRIVQFSVQRDHMHLVVEASDKHALSRGMQGLVIRLARAINRALRRSGRVFGDRYHAQPLKSPRQVRNALLYVLANFRKHFHTDPRPALDPCSSAPWFEGWSARPPCPSDDPPVVAPRTWLLTVGWKRHGLLSPSARPGPPEAPHLA